MFSPTLEGNKCETCLKPATIAVPSRQEHKKEVGRTRIDRRRSGVRTQSRDEQILDDAIAVIQRNIGEFTRRIPLNFDVIKQQLNDLETIKLRKLRKCFNMTKI